MVDQLNLRKKGDNRKRGEKADNLSLVRDIGGE